MCGRYTHRYTWREVHDFLDLRFPAELNDSPLRDSFNVAPTQMAPIARCASDGDSLELLLTKWGLVPFWAKDAKIGNALINARAEGIDAKPAYRAAFKKRRCVVPVSGFYEWEKVEGSKTKQPWYITRADGEIMLLAGLWERWDKGEPPIESHTIVTTEANQFMTRLHSRMPVVLEREKISEWLDPRAETADLRAMLGPAADGVLTAHRVSTKVNKPAFNDPECIAAVG